MMVAMSDANKTVSVVKAIRFYATAPSGTLQSKTQKAAVKTHSKPAKMFKYGVTRRTF